MSIFSSDIDDYDRKIIYWLQSNALLTNAVLAEKIGLSASAINERIRKLKEKNIIKRIVAQVNAAAVAKALGAFIYVLIEKPEQIEPFLKAMRKQDAVLECHHVTGEYSYLLKIRVENTKALEDFISNFLKQQQGVSKTLTQIILSSTKDGTTVID